MRGALLPRPFFADPFQRVRMGQRAAEADRPGWREIVELTRRDPTQIRRITHPTIDLHRGFFQGWHHHLYL